ncbi:MAG: class I SAM-dependent methyltransferase [Caulobacterales bacterium]|nr:class I SAM-dependent methyltransferase [Caulobacterales bacterium]
MEERKPSQTAVAAAGYRAAHQVLDGGRIFSDPLACAVLGPEADTIIGALTGDAAHTRARVFMAARSRFAEDSLAVAVARGVRQAVVLGAGLDTSGLRNPHADQGLRTFEVDHPATQAWKLKRIADAGLSAPASLIFAAIDLEREDLGHGLLAAGFDPHQPAFFLWLGVVPYLRPAAISATLRYIAGVPGAEVVFDYSEPLENYPPDRRAEMVALGSHAAQAGEPWLSHFDPADIARELKGLGLGDQEDLDVAGIAVRYLGVPAVGPAAPGPHVMRARRGEGGR